MLNKGYKLFILEDPSGDNEVSRVEKVKEGYKIIGCNASGDGRYIIIGEDGEITGYNGSELGIVGNLMAKHAAKILMFFNIFVEIPGILTQEQISRYQNAQKRKKFFVINGHGSKSDELVKIPYSVILPDRELSDYSLSFSDQARHLEEATIYNKIMPIKYEDGKECVWCRYKNNTAIHNINITPLQGDDSAKTFFEKLITGTTGWGKIANKNHNIVENGILVLRNKEGAISFFNGEGLKQYILYPDINYTPLFFVIQ